MDWTARRATRSDNDALIALLRDVPIEGALTLAQDRAPDFFAMERLHDATSDTWVAEAPDGALVGCGTLVVRDGWFPDGARRPVGLITDLRVRPAWRSAKVLPRLGRAAFEHARDAHGCEVAMTAVMDANARVVGAATRGGARREAQPVSRPILRYEMANVQWMPRTRTRAEVTEDLDEVAAFLDARQRTKLFGRPVDAKRLETLGLRFHVVRREGRIVAAAAPWDVGEAKRMRVLAYGRALGAYRRAWDAVAPLLGRPRLPAPGEALRYTTLSHVEVEGDDPHLLRELLAAAWEDARDAHFLAAMVPRGSPLARAFRGTGTHRSPMSLLLTALPENPWTNDDPPSAGVGFEMALA